MLRSANGYKPQSYSTNDFRRHRVFNDRDNWAVNRNLPGRKRTCDLGRDHVLAAILPMIRRRTRHRTAAFHRSRVPRHRGDAIPELQEQKSARCQDQE